MRGPERAPEKLSYLPSRFTHHWQNNHTAENSNEDDHDNTFLLLPVLLFHPELAVQPQVSYRLSLVLSVLISQVKHRDSWYPFQLSD